MIDGSAFNFIKNLTTEYWNERVKTPQFIVMAQGKETGHRIADSVDEKTYSRLNSENLLDIKHETNKSGKILTRSMGDLWIKSNGIYNPVNIKSGIVANGQPNMVSLTKLLTRLLAHQIDSYYLLIIKFMPNGNSLTPKIYFVDMLDYLDFIAFDAGPGQAMLKEKDFYTFIDSGRSTEKLSLLDKIQKCVDVIDDGHKRLISNRKITIDRLRDAFGRFNTAPINQTGLYFG